METPHNDSPKSPDHFESAERLEALPSEIDTDTTLFAYGSLLDLPTLRKLVEKNRKDFQVHETESLEEARELTKAHPTDVVILRGVRLDGIRASVVTDVELRRFYADQGKSVEQAIAQGIWDSNEPQRESFLIARVAQGKERGRPLNGGLIMGLSKTDLETEMDPFEIPPVYERRRVPKVTIEGRAFKPEHVTFYAGGGEKPRRNMEDVIQAKQYARARVVRDDGTVLKSGYSSDAKWPQKVRSDKERFPKAPPQK